MSISSITSSAFGKAIKSKPVQKCCKYFEEHQTNAIAYATLASLVGKDGIGCYLYVTQSLHNKKIPEDKRRFVANMDLVNGILMMMSQVGFFFAIKKFNEPLFDKLFKKSFGSEAFKTLATKTRKILKEKNVLAIKEGQAPVVVPRKSELKKEHSKLREQCCDAFKNVTNIIAATILAKRIFVPFVSTPIAQYITNKHDEKLEAKKALAQGANKEAKPEQKPTEQLAQKLDITSTGKSENSGNTNLLTKFHK